MIDNSWWKTYTEPEIHEIIACCYEFVGYTVMNTHRAGASHERGVDLFVENNSERIAFQVKIKPKGDDRAQLLDLSRVECDRRIYVYVEDPVRSFVDEMNNPEMKAKVEFWNTDATLDSLHKLMPYGFVQMMLSHTNAVETILRIVDIIDPIVSEGRDLSTEEHRNLSNGLTSVPTIPQVMWEGKDFASSFHKTSKYLFRLLENQETKGLGNSRPYGLVPEAFEVLQELDQDILRRLERTLSLIVRDAADYLRRLVSAIRMRSIWITFYHFRNQALGFRTTSLTNIAQWRASAYGRSYSSDTEEAMRGIESSKGIVRFLGELLKLGRDFELLIDWLYDSYFNPEFDEVHEDWKGRA